MALNYEPLYLDDYEIRLLTILPGPLTSTVRCTMEKASLINPVKYTALSYCWGDTTITEGVFVNGVEIPATINLVDALQYLRSLGVSTVWADAICINQNDKQEKGLQIRNMRQIYSKAYMTYGWLGRREDDNTKAVFAFLKSVLGSHDDAYLKAVPHTCTSTVPALHSAGQRRPQIGDCPRCTTESSFQGLQDLLLRQYWERRWIIQETLVSYRHIVLTEDSAIDIEELDRAITRCRESSYWNLDLEKAYLWFQTIAKFRHSYRVDTRPSLCRAIAMSRDFKSTDPRDAIFSLLGLCHDGPELVPTPNYLQPIEKIVTDLTRALVWKYKHLNFLWIEGINRTNLDILPSWAPDWLSKTVPSEAYDLAKSDPTDPLPRFYLGDSINRGFSLGDGQVL